MIGDATEPVNAERAAEGTYALTSPTFKTAGPIELVFSITGEAGEDLLAGTLTVPSDAAAAPRRARPRSARCAPGCRWSRRLADRAARAQRSGLYGGYFLLRRSFVQAAAMALMAVAGVGLLFETARGHGGDTHRTARPQKVSLGGRFAAPAAGRACLCSEADPAPARRPHRAIGRRNRRSAPSV